MFCVNKSLGVIEEEMKSFQPYWKVSRAKVMQKEKEQNDDPHKENKNKTSVAKKE